MRTQFAIWCAATLLLAGCASKPESAAEAAKQAAVAAEKAAEAAKVAADKAKDAAETARVAAEAEAKEGKAKEEAKGVQPDGKPEAKQEAKDFKPEVTPEKKAEAKPPAKPAPLQLAAGTVLVVRTTSTLSTKTVKSGDTFAASLEEPLVADGVVLAAKGAAVKGRVVEADPGGRVKGVASLTVEVTEVTLQNGKALAVDTSDRGVAARSTKQKDALKVGIGAGVGAAIGAIAGGGKGAAIGAASGGGAGAGVVLATRGEPAVIRAETVLRFPLTAAVEIPR